jgi:dCMP deaminase
MGGFTPHSPSFFDPIRDIARGNCFCGKWLVIPQGFTKTKPLVCGGTCGSGDSCGRQWFWEDDDVRALCRHGFVICKSSDRCACCIEEDPTTKDIKKVARPPFEEIYMDFAFSLSRRSTCSRTQVGAVVISSDYQRVLSVGYNGGPRGVFNDCLSDEPGKCGHLHAEVNALLKMDYNDPVRKVMLVTYNPCFNCAVAIINARIDEVVYAKEYRLTDGIDLLRKANVQVRKQGEVQVGKDG